MKVLILSLILHWAGLQLLGQSLVAHIQAEVLEAASQSGFRPHVSVGKIIRQGD